MKKNLLRLIILLLSPCWLLAQPATAVDSLQQVILQKRATSDKQGEAEVLFALGNIYYDQRQDQLALEQITAALQVAPVGNTTLMGKLLYRKAMLLYFIGQDFSKPLPLMDSAYVLLKSTDDPTILVPFLQSYGSMLNQGVNCKKGQRMLLEAEQICLDHPEIGTTDRLLNLYSNLLAAAQSLSDFNAALTYARKGIEVGKNSGNLELLADLHYNNALTLSTLGYQKEAEQHYLKSMALYKKGKVTSGIVSASLALGNFYCREGQSTTGFQYLNQVKAMASQTNDLYSIAVAHQMESDGYVAIKNYPKALNAIDSCIQYFAKTNDPRRLLGICYQKAVILKATNHVEDAILWAKNELALADTTQSKLFVYSTYQLLAEIEKERQHFEQALVYHELYAAFKDSSYNQNLEAKLAEERTRQNVDAEHEARRKAELEARVLNATNQVYEIIAISLALILLTGGYLYRQLQHTRKQLVGQNKQLEQLNHTKDKFFGIIAHDLRNPLSAFQGVGEQLQYHLEKGQLDKLKKTSDHLTKSAANLSGLLDNLLSWALMNRGMIPHHPKALTLLPETIAVLDIYDTAIKAKTIRIERHIPDDLQVLADQNGLRTILRNLIGNAVKFTPLGGQITISAKEKENNVLIRVQDTGVGIADGKISQLFTLEKQSEYGTSGEKGTGLGLILCKELVELNHGTLAVSSKIGAGSSFEISLPMA